LYFRYIASLGACWPGFRGKPPGTPARQTLEPWFEGLSGRNVCRNGWQTPGRYGGVKGCLGRPTLIGVLIRATERRYGPDAFR
jgi:hypothetical protein